MRKVFVRNIEYIGLIEQFLIAAITAILVTRFYLIATNYPQIGGNGLHIAHMLWGGLLMLIAFMFLFSFASKMILQLSALISGLGFGLFIDELGKFVTSDNNYFFQPTFSIIYIIFIIVYLSSKALGKYKFSQQEYLVNSLEMLKEAVINDLDIEEKKRALEYLNHVNHRDKISLALEQTLKKISTVNPNRLDKIGQFKKKLKIFYFNLTQRKWFIRSVDIFFILQAIATILGAGFLALGIGAIYIKHLLPDELEAEILNITPFDIIQFLATLLSGLCIVWGVLIIRRSRIKAYDWFKRNILISIFVTQVFSFYENQVWAIFGLVLDILILAALNYMITREQLDQVKT